MGDYAGWLRALDAALGAENICPLLLEESNTVSFWQTLEGFAGLEALDPAAMVRGAGNPNRRRAGVDQWAISAFDAHAKAKVAVDKPLNLLWPKGGGTSNKALAKRLGRPIEALGYDTQS